MLFLAEHEEDKTELLYSVNFQQAIASYDRFHYIAQE